MGMAVLQPLGKTVWQFVKNLSTNLPYDLASLHPDRYLKDRKRRCVQRPYTGVSSSCVCNGQELGITQLSSTDEWQIVGYVQNRVLFNNKKE